jgi:2-polyprenyl-6-methoxyphenol hydroxylase-like FAD-dependent oxidoreductase
LKHLVVSGGGVAGAGLACALSGLIDYGEVEITVLEKENEEDIGHVKRGQVLRPEATKLIYETKLIEYIRRKNPVLKPKPKEELWHTALGLTGTFDYEIFARGYPMIYLPHPLIVESLHERMRELGIRVIYGAEALSAFRDNGDGKNKKKKIGVAYRTKSRTKSSSITGGTTINRVEGDMLVVADGATSSLRSSLGIEVDFFDYRSGYLVVILDKLPDFENDRFYVSERGFVPIFSLPEEKMRAMVELSVGDLREWMSLSPEKVQRRLAEWIPDLGKSRVLEIGSFYHVIRRHARSYVADRAALIGDSAHTTHPMLGQGMSMVFNDIAALSDIIRSDPGDFFSPSNRAEYESRARPFDSWVLENSHELHEAILEFGRDPGSLGKHKDLLERVGFHPLRAL